MCRTYRSSGDGYQQLRCSCARAHDAPGSPPFASAVMYKILIFTARDTSCFGRVSCACVCTTAAGKHFIDITSIAITMMHHCPCLLLPSLFFLFICSDAVLRFLIDAVLFVAQVISSPFLSPAHISSSHAFILDLSL